jgi:hypothetical protein
LVINAESVLSLTRFHLHLQAHMVWPKPDMRYVLIGAKVAEIRFAQRIDASGGNTNDFHATQIVCSFFFFSS